MSFLKSRYSEFFIFFFFLCIGFEFAGFDGWPVIKRFLYLPADLYRPEGVFAILFPQRLNLVFLEYLFLCWQVFLVLGIFTFYYSILTRMACLLTVFWFLHYLSYGYQTHTVYPLGLLSVLLLIFGKIEEKRERLFLAVLPLFFLAAGLSKVWLGFSDWLTGETLFVHLSRAKALHPEDPGFLGNVIQYHVLMFSPVSTIILSVSTLILEICLPIILLGRLFRKTRVEAVDLFLIILLGLMQIFFFILLQVNFWVWLPLYLLWPLNYYKGKRTKKLEY